MNRFLLFAASALCLFTLFLFRVRPTQEVPSVEEIVAAVLYWPAFLAAVLITITAALRLAAPDSRGSAIICILLCLPFLGHAYNFHLKAAEHERWVDWSSLAAQINPLMGEYYAAHPDSFRYLTANSEEVRIDGFAEFALTRIPNLKNKTVDGRLCLRDPWGEPVCFVMSHGDDEAIEARGMHESILFGGGDERLFNNPHGLGIARYSCPEPHESGENPVIVYMSYEFSRQSIRDNSVPK